MKRILTFAWLVLLIGCSSDEFDASSLWDSIGKLEDRVEKLEELCNRMNNDISALETIVSALEKNDYVTSITPVTLNGEVIGYTMVFAKSGTITIYHGEDGEDGANGADGKDGKDGETPTIGVKRDADGVFYWTLNGEWLKDDNGNKIKAEGRDGADGRPGTDGENGADGKPGVDGKDGITPELRINNGYWEISYDNGKSWKQLGKADGEDGKDGNDGVFKSVTEDEANVYLTLSDGTVIVMSKSQLVLTASSSCIYSDGIDAVEFSATLNGVPVKDFTVYDNEGNAVENNRFTTTNMGTYTFHAIYNATSCRSNEVTVTTVIRIPEGVTDTQPANFDFKKRVMCMMCGGTDCMYAPYMIAAFRQVLADDTYNDRFTLARAYTFSSYDRFYIGSYFADGFGVADYSPIAKVDLRDSFSNISSVPSETAAYIKDRIDEYHAKGATAAIAVNMSVADNRLTARMDIKVSETNQYRVGAWILEDNLTYNQNNNGVAGDFSIHNHVLRLADSNDGTSQYDYYGYDLDSINAGGYASHIFNIELDEAWNIDNCHVLFFVTTLDDRGARFVTNSVDVPLRTQRVNFEYK